MNFDDMRYKSNKSTAEKVSDIFASSYGANVEANKEISSSKSKTTSEIAKGDYLIGPNIFRALKRVKNDETGLFVNDLVDPTIRKDFMELFNIADSSEKEFSITKEFQTAYQVVKTNLVASPDDTQLLNTTQRFLQFMLNNELKINGIDAVKSFKEAVFSVLDDIEPSLKDKVVEKFNSLVEV